MLKDLHLKLSGIIKILILVCIFTFHSEVFANDKCVCPPKSNLASEFKRNSVVFLGQVVEVRPQFPLHNNYYYVRFLPMKKFKGTENYPNSENVVVYAPVSEDPCTFRFIKGNDYLVFAEGNPAFLKADSCSFTGLQEDRGQEILELNKLTGK